MDVVELLDFSPRSDCLLPCTRRPLIGCGEELSHEVDVATVRDLRESPHLVQDAVLPGEAAAAATMPTEE